MAIVRDQKVYWDGYDLTGKLSSLKLEYGCETLDDTALNDTFRSAAAGQFTCASSIDGFFEAGATFEAAMMSNMGVTDKPFSIANAAAEGSVAWFYKMMEGSYSPFKNSVGELHSFSAGGMANSVLVRGQLLASKTVSATGNGTGFQLGAVPAGKKLYIAAHVLSKSGTNPTLDLITQSDDNNGFSSASTAGTLVQMTGVGSQWLEVSGAITDDWFRVRYVVGGTGSPSFNFIVLAGIR